MVKTVVRCAFTSVREEIWSTLKAFGKRPISSAASSAWWHGSLAFCMAIMYGLLMSVGQAMAFVYGYGHVLCIGLALWRKGQDDYGSVNNGGDATATNLAPALDIFYSLVLFQGALYLIWSVLEFYGLRLLIIFRRGQKMPRKEWARNLLVDYLMDTRARCWKDPASIHVRTFRHHVVGLLDSGSLDDNLSGARMLDLYIRQGIDLRPLLLPSRPKVQKLIDTLGWRSGAREMRELAARIVAHLAGDIHLSQFPGAIRSISTLLLQLETRTTQAHWDLHRSQTPPPRKQDMLRRFERNDRKVEARLQRKRMQKKDGDQEGDANVQERKQVDGCGDDAEGPSLSNDLILQGLTILERLAFDHHNCRDICGEPGLVPKIMSPLCSENLIRGIRISAWADIINGTFKVLHRLASSTIRTSRRLRRVIFSNKQAMRNLEKIFDKASEAGQELQMGAMEILTELAMDSYLCLSTGTSEYLIKQLLQIFLDDEQAPAAMLSRLRVTAGTKLVLLSTNSGNNSDSIFNGCDDIVGRLTEMLDAKNNIIIRAIAAQILENLCVNIALDKDHVKETLLPKVLAEIMSSRRELPQVMTNAQQTHEENTRISAPGSDEKNQKNSVPGNNEVPHENFAKGDNEMRSYDQVNEEETATKPLQEAFLSLTLAICDKLISSDDFNDVIQNNVQEHIFVAKLKIIVEKNCQETAGSLRIVKLCGQTSVLLMQRNHYPEDFRSQEFVKALSEAANNMSNLESCMRFAGADFQLKETAWPLLSDLTKDTIEFLG